MHATVVDFKGLLSELSSCNDGRTLTAERLAVLFGSRLSYKELTELLCDYIVAYHMQHNGHDCEFIGELLIKLRVIESEFKSLNERYKCALTTISEAEKQRFEALNEAAILKMRNIELAEKLSQFDDQSTLLHYSKEGLNA